VKRFTLALVLALALVPHAARAGELDLTGDLSTFSSPDNVIGPWHALTATYRWVTGADTPSVTAVTRSDADRLDPTHSNGAVVDDYHTWSPRFFTYAAVGAAAGDVLPTRNFYVEGDQKLGRVLTTVIGGGVGVVVNPNGVIQRYINVGPTLYTPSFNITLRYLQTFTTGRTASGTGIMTFQTGQTGKTIGTLTLLAGSQPPNDIAAQAQTIELGQRDVSAGIGWNGSTTG
jgi:YaiO family outer membrane protein